MDWGCSGCLSTRGRDTNHEDKPPGFILADRKTEETYVHPAKADELSKIQLLFADLHQESLIDYTEGYCAYEPINENAAFGRQYVVYGMGEYANEDVHVKTGENHASLCDGEPHLIAVYPRTPHILRQVVPGTNGLTAL